MINLRCISLLQNSWRITSLISDVEPDVNMSTNLYWISVTGIPGGSVMFIFNCLFKDVNRLVHCKSVRQNITVLGALVRNSDSSVASNKELIHFD